MLDVIAIVDILVVESTHCLNQEFIDMSLVQDDMGLMRQSRLSSCCSHHSLDDFSLSALLCPKCDLEDMVGLA